MVLAVKGFEPEPRSNTQSPYSTGGADERVAATLAGQLVCTTMFSDCEPPAAPPATSTVIIPGHVISTYFAMFTRTGVVPEVAAITGADNIAITARTVMIPSSFFTILLLFFPAPPP